jgi:hypothetical protein
MGGHASDPGAVTAEPALPQLPIVPRIVRRTFVDTHAVLRPIALAERVASTRRGRVLGKLVVAAMFLVALAAYARLNIRDDPEGASSTVRVRAAAPRPTSAVLPPRPALSPRIPGVGALPR